MFMFGFIVSLVSRTKFIGIDFWIFSVIWDCGNVGVLLLVFRILILIVKILKRFRLLCCWFCLYIVILNSRIYLILNLYRIFRSRIFAVLIVFDFLLIMKYEVFLFFCVRIWNFMRFSFFWVILVFSKLLMVILFINVLWDCCFSKLYLREIFWFIFICV